MPVTRARTGPAPGPPARDQGFTLVEFVIAMGLFAVLISIFMLGITNMTKYTIQGENSDKNTSEARAVYTKLDRQVRDASAINAVSTNGGTFYLEFRNGSVPAGTSPTCTQWRFNPALDLITYRIFNDVTSPATPAWIQVTNGMTNTTSPVAMLPADASHTKQRLTLNLTLKQGSTRASQINTVLVARNTGVDTVTNLLSSGLSQTPVCRQLGQP